MARYCNHYECPCGHQWQDEWDCGCDDRCPMCNTSCAPSASYDLDNPEEIRELKENHDYETLEEHQARMKRIRDEAKADTKVKRYQWSDPSPKIWDDYPRDYMKPTTRSSFYELYMGHFDKMVHERSKETLQIITLDSLPSPSKHPFPSFLMDECHYIEPQDMWLHPEPRKKDWDQKNFVSGPATTPSEATRIKRREERNRKRKKK